jgi:hypothetical protein
MLDKDIKKIIAHFYGDLWIEPFRLLNDEKKISLEYAFLENPLQTELILSHFPNTIFINADKLRTGDLDIQGHEYQQELNEEFDLADIIKTLYEYEPILLPMLQRDSIYKEFKGLIDWRITYYKILFNLFDLLIRIKPDLVFFSEIPHNYGSFLLYLLSQKLKISTLMLVMPMELKGYIYAVKDFQQGNILINKKYKEMSIYIDSEEAIEINKKLELELLRFKMDYNSAIPIYVKDNIKKGKTKFVSINHIKMIYKRKKEGIILHNTMLKRIIIRLKTAYWHRQLPKVYSDFTNKVNLQSDYIYFALHYQPEQTSVPMAGYFENQYFVAALIAKNLPAGWKLFIKENPYQFLKMEPSHQAFKNEFFYKSLQKLPNTYLVPINTNNFDLIDNSKAVVTLTGMIGWEALNRQKPVAVFGYASYKACSGVFIIKNEKDLKGFINNIDQSLVEPDKQKIRLYLKTVYEHSFRGVIKDFELILYNVSNAENAKGWYDCIKSSLESEELNP